MKCPDERPTLGCALQEQQDAGAESVENALGVAERRMPRQFGFHTVQPVMHVGRFRCAGLRRGLSLDGPIHREADALFVLHGNSGHLKRWDLLLHGETGLQVVRFG